MLFENLYFDENWITNGYFFKHVDSFRKTEFIRNFMRYAQEADIDLIFTDLIPKACGGFNCLELTDGSSNWFVQSDYLKEIGFDYKESDSFDFKFTFNLERKLIFVYSTDEMSLIGGLMPVVFPETSQENEA